VASSRREDKFWVAGFWSAVHLVTLLLTPDPISPWLLYAAVYGESGLPTDLESIRALDPHSATTLEPWFALRATDIIGDGVGGPVQQLLMLHLDIHEVSSRHLMLVFAHSAIVQRFSTTTETCGTRSHHKKTCSFGSSRFS
jgi:hypothetical protein